MVKACYIMDYTIGSLSDLITGKNTPNKTIVIKRKLPQRTSKDEHLKSSPSIRSGKIGDKMISKKGKKKSSAPRKSNLTVINCKQVTNSNEDSSFTDKPQADCADTVDDVEVMNSAGGRDPSAEAEVNSRTVFVGNIATTVTKKQLMILFGKYGKVQSVRFRCATAAQPGISKKLALMRKMLHPKRATLNAYVIFESREQALESIKLNAKKYKEHYLRVQLCSDTEKPDPRKAIFIGNLPFDVEDDDLWAAFEKIGSIKSVRTVRNSQTGMGIGIGYVNFNSTDSVELALQLGDVLIKSNTVRIKRCNDMKQKRKERKRDKQEQGTQTIKHSGKLTKLSESSSQHKTYKLKHNVQSNSESNLYAANATRFQGAKFKQKKKRKVDKGAVKKMKLSQKIAPRSN